MSDNAVGRCSNCGGAVTVPMAWNGLTPPVPECTRCGYVKSIKDLPEIDMTPKGDPNQIFLQE